MKKKENFWGVNGIVTISCNWKNKKIKKKKQSNQKVGTINEKT